MTLIQWAVLGLTSLAAAAVDVNTTHESRNILPSTFAPPKHFQNLNLVRNINLEKSYPRETLNVVVENIDKAAQKEYYIPFEQGTLGRIGGLEVRDKKEPEKAKFEVDVVGIDPSRYDQESPTKAQLQCTDCGQARPSSTRSPFPKLSHPRSS